MKQDEFRKWLVAQGQTDAAASSRVSSAKRAEQYLGDLDELFAQEDRDSILNRFAYTAEDERAERPNPSPVPIDGVLRTGLASLQQALKLYHSFLTEQSNVPDKAEHQALVDRLTRSEVDATMYECDQLGLKAFLARGGFASPQVWVSDEGKDQSYPAKAIVAAALGHLPAGRALTAKEFFNGYGESQSFARLEALGYQVLRKAANARDDVFSRSRIEGAMDAYDQFRTSGAHADAFSSFGAPSEYWVRSTRPREDRRFPTKPIVGYLLGKAANALTGGWSQPHDAAARLHAAGYIIVDQNDVPLPLPEQYTHLMRGAERARLVARNYFIEPAREAGLLSVTIRAGDLHDMCGLVRNWANVCQALEKEAFQQLASVPAPTRTGPERSTTTEYTFVLARDGAAKDEIMPQAVQTATTTNLILYGPPGTGKTYQTAWEAVRLCLDADVAEGLLGETNRDRLMAEYRRLMTEGRIEFVTFHQSMSYEEFVEGLRPNTTSETAGDPDNAGAGFRLAPHDGVFKRLSERARQAGFNPVRSDRGSKLDLTRRVFKMSLGDTSKADGELIFNECIRDGKMLMGFNLGVDWSDEIYSDIDEILARTRQIDGREDTSRDSGFVSFHNTLRNVIENGDIILVSRGLRKLRAIGVVTGRYSFDAARSDNYRHGRPVDWLWVSTTPETDIDVDSFYPNEFSRQTLYMLQKPIDWSVVLTATGLADAAESAGTEPQSCHVLIIDEINRANISKVFGELITLVEPDKRLGRRDEIQLTLPYSKQRFGVPPNLHIIGTMNTADRSIALLDTALRRRFTFKELMPNPAVLSPNVGGINLQKLLATINDRIEYLFDREHQIGHAYFTGCKSPGDVEDIMRHRVIPLLSEYFYEDWSKVAAVLGDGPQGPSRFLEARQLAAPPGIAADDFAGERLRWRVKDQFDFSEFPA